jgi:hypothetical protein
MGALTLTSHSGVYQEVLDGRSGTWWIGAGWCCRLYLSRRTYMQETDLGSPQQSESFLGIWLQCETTLNPRDRIE